MNQFSDVLFGIEFRTYQKKLLERFKELHSTGDQIFHFLAPPGAGKTILGLEMIRRLGRSAVVLSPNSAIQVQWMQKLKGMTDQISISDDPFSDADIISLTYQSITVKERGSEKENTLHKNSARILQALRNRHTIVLDECHHLTSFWAEIIKTMIHDQAFVIGLTATPPIHREQKAINNYLEILGEIDYQIPLPSIVKEGFLAPFQDLVYFTEPEEEEMTLLMQADEEYRSLMNDLMKPDNDTIPPIHYWAHDQLRETTDQSGLPFSFEELYQEKPDYCTALVRFTKAFLNEVPLSVFPMDEFETELELIDSVRVVGAYANRVLKADIKAADLLGKVENVLQNMGYSLTSRGVQPIQKGVARILSLSSSKLKGMQTILEQEWFSMQDSLRALILTDFELGRHSDGTSAIDVMRAITSHSVTDETDPILVTGKTVLVDDDLLDHFMAAADVFIQNHGLSITLSAVPVEGYMKIQGSGTDWKTKNSVSMITDMFERGICKCLIGTRALLGEGWDSIKANTLIDLTTASTFVSVNQIRGRTLRFDSGNSLKTANNWDIVTFSGNIDKGFLDYDRLVQKHAQFFGLSDDLMIEKGIGHLHPLFSNAPKSRVFADREKINAEMLERSKNRLEIYKGWKVGEPYTGESQISLEIIPGTKKRKSYQIASRSVEALQISFRKMAKTRKAGLSAAAVTAIAAGVSLALFRQMVPGILLSCTAALILTGAVVGLHRLMKKAGSKVSSGSDTESVLREFAKTLLFSLQEIGEVSDSLTEESICVIGREDGSFRVFLKNCLNQTGFSRALAELMGPIFNQKYIIAKQQCLTPSGWKQWFNKEIRMEITGYHPVPEIFGRRRKTAEIFKKHWNACVSPGDLVYAKGKKGKVIIKNHLGRKILDVGHRKKEIWF